MASWEVAVRVYISRLLELEKNFSRVPEAMMEITEDVAIEVRENIVREGVIDTGALLDSITAERRDEQTTIVRDGVEYGVYQEFGTSRIAARPFFTPAIENFGEIFERIFTKVLK